MSEVAKRLRILIVDDDPLVRRAMARDLHQHEVHEAEGISEAVEILTRTPLDLVISDCVMPGSSGIEVLQAARLHQPHAIRVMVSGHPPSNVDQLIEEGLLSRCFKKPWQPNFVEALGLTQEK